MYGSKKPSNTNTTDVFFTFKVTCRFSNLWVAHYSKYQQFLYETICKYRKKGWNYVEIANWLNENNYKTPRGKKFLNAHAISIVKNKIARDARLSKRYSWKISDFAISFVDTTLINQ